MTKLSLLPALLGLVLMADITPGAEGKSHPPQVFWVDAQAATDGDGSAASPFQTIQAAALVAFPGDTVRVLPGVYRERVMPPRGGEPGRPIRYVSEVRHCAVVKGSDVWTPTWRDEGGGLYSGELDATRFTDTNYVDGGNPYRISYEWDKVRNQLPPVPFASVSWTLGQVFFDGAPLRETSSRTELGRHALAWWYDAAVNRLVVNSGNHSPQGRLVEITTRRGVFRPREKGLGYLEVRGFVFEHCANQFPAQFWTLPENAQSGMVGTRGGHHWVISDNIIRHAKSVGLSFGASGGSRGRAFDNERPARVDPAVGQVGFHRIEGNLFFANGAVGAMGYGHTRVVFEKNVFLGNNALHNTAYETGGIKTHQAHELRIEGNWFVDNECMGVWLDNTWKSCNLSRNLFAGNRGRSLFLEMDDNPAQTACVVDANLFLDSRQELVPRTEPDTQPPSGWKPWAAGIYGHDADGVRMVNNLFSGGGYGLYFRKITNRKGGAAHVVATGNIFAGDTMTAACLPVENPPWVRGNHFDYNVYPASPDGRVFAATAWSASDGKLARASFDRLTSQLADAASTPPPFGKADAAAGYYLNLDQWRAVMGFDEHSFTAPLRCEFDRAAWTLTLTVPTNVLHQIPLPVAAAADFFGNPFGATAVAGPFASLKPGCQVIHILAPPIQTVLGGTDP